CQQYNDWNSF
nr:immunoglobulin light chain junction region [Macaca mulatta]MOX51632.1 immunoglobulin light chain junction region [Macaca mulatta]MOX51691.1 immunoglobulin light chain junction region [Macaca mulatta]MOX51727.1 immunoglobulin light chain junction region [Macaca mulatta]MOX51740.1 immunoglobulin light chain junction region [Macaca mulatta]